jgi:hypothetical protein
MFPWPSIIFLDVVVLLGMALATASRSKVALGRKKHDIDELYIFLAPAGVFLAIFLFGNIYIEDRRPMNQQRVVKLKKEIAKYSDRDESSKTILKLRDEMMQWQDPMQKTPEQRMNERKTQEKKIQKLEEELSQSGALERERKQLEDELKSDPWFLTIAGLIPLFLGLLWLLFLVRAEYRTP